MNASMESSIRSRIDVDTKAINEMMKELRFIDKEARRAVRSGLRDSAGIIKRAATQRLSAISSDRQKRKGVKAVVYKNASGAQVNIYTPFYINRNGKKRLFILRWFEEGTKESTLNSKDHWSSKNNRHHGATRPLPFFHAAVEASKAQAEKALSDNIIERINKIASKRK